MVSNTVFRFSDYAWFNVGIFSLDVPVSSRRPTADNPSRKFLKISTDGTGWRLGQLPSKKQSSGLFSGFISFSGRRIFRILKAARPQGRLP